MFTGEKIAQMATFFMVKENGCQIPILKLVKLLYLADRESIDRYDEPISYDKMVSMEHGPVLSRTYDLICGCVGGNDARQWGAWISNRATNDVVLKKKNISREALDHLSDADIEVLETVWGQFGHMNKWQIRRYTHEHCEEWEDTQGSSWPIDNIRLLLALGRNEQEAKEAAHLIDEQRELDRAISTA